MYYWKTVRHKQHIHVYIFHNIYLQFLSELMDTKLIGGKIQPFFSMIYQSKCLNSKAKIKKKCIAFVL